MAPLAAPYLSAAPVLFFIRQMNLSQISMVMCTEIGTGGVQAEFAECGRNGGGGKTSSGSPAYAARHRPYEPCTPP